MFRLTTKLACSNLIKNRKLYYPFAIAVILAVTIAYLFDSLTFNPHISQLRGGSPMLFTLGLGLFVVNVAGAIITSPEILLADEPTGALDSKSSAALLDVFEDINTMGQTILMVTHSTAAAARAKRVLFIKDGILYNQIFRGEKTERQMFQEISDTLTVMASEVE